MSKQAITPKAKKYAQDNRLTLDGINGSGEFGAIVFSDIKDMKKKKATNLAKNMARYYGIDIEHLDTVDGIIRKKDIEKQTNTAIVKPLAQKRKALAENIIKSLNGTAQFTVFSELDTTDFISKYRIIKECAAQTKEINITLSDMLIFAVSKVLMNIPKFNSSIVANQVYSYNYVNLSLAIHCEDGVLAPVIMGSNTLSLSEIALKREELVSQTRNRMLSNDQLIGGTFTLSNLGNSQITYFTPLINYPQSAILGVGRTEQKPAVVDGEIAVRNYTYFSLTMDHFLIDGKDGANFIDELKTVLDSPIEYFNI